MQSGDQQQYGLTVGPVVVRRLLLAEIIGAARWGMSYCHMLARDLCSYTVNNLWRHGNALNPHDKLGRLSANENVQHCVRRQLEGQAVQGTSKFGIETSCTASWRIR